MKKSERGILRQLRNASNELGRRINISAGTDKSGPGSLTANDDENHNKGRRKPQDKRQYQHLLLEFATFIAGLAFGAALNYFGPNPPILYVTFFGFCIFGGIHICLTLKSYVSFRVWALLAGIALLACIALWFPANRFINRLIDGEDKKEKARKDEIRNLKGEISGLTNDLFQARQDLFQARQTISKLFETVVDSVPGLVFHEKLDRVTVSLGGIDCVLKASDLSKPKDEITVGVLDGVDPNPVKPYIEHGRLFCDIEFFPIGGLPHMKLQRNLLIGKPTEWDSNWDDRGIEVVNESLTPIFQMYWKSEVHVVFNGILPINGTLFICEEGHIETFGPTSFKKRFPDGKISINLKPIFKYPAYANRGVRDK